MNAPLYAWDIPLLMSSFFYFQSVISENLVFCRYLRRMNGMDLRTFPFIIGKSIYFSRFINTGHLNMCHPFVVSRHTLPRTSPVRIWDKTRSANICVFTPVIVCRATIKSWYLVITIDTVWFIWSISNWSTLMILKIIITPLAMSLVRMNLVSFNESSLLILFSFANDKCVFGNIIGKRTAGHTTWQSAIIPFEHPLTTCIPYLNSVSFSTVIYHCYCRNCGIVSASCTGGTW